jgi:polysaccharide biosynthesis/export protein
MNVFCSTHCRLSDARKPLSQKPWNGFQRSSASLGGKLLLSTFLWAALVAPVFAQAQQAPRQQPRQQSPRQQPSRQPASVPTSVVQSVNPGEYLLGPGDRLKIDVFSVPEFSGEYQVLPDGTVNMPLIGAVLVQGRSLQQATSIISAKYNAFLQRPTITVSLLAARPIQVAIAGEVNRPGSYSIAASTSAAGDSNSANITRILQLAEGVTQSADLRQVQIRRARATGAGDELIKIDLWQLLKAGDGRQDIRLRDGDSIFIPATTAVNLEESQQLAAANFASRNNRPIKITVIGEVYRPGPYTLIEGAVGQRDQLINPNLLQVPSVTRAIQVAGGITQLADVRNVQVRRLTRSGPPQIINLDFWKLLKTGDSLQDLPLQDGDTVQIPTATALSNTDISELATASFSPDKINVNVVGEVERPGALALQPNSPLNQAILAAGGFNGKAKKAAVTLIRVNPNGSVSKRDVSIDFAQGVSDDRNPPLRNNDIVVVRKTGLAKFLDGAGAFLGPFTGITNFFRLFGP